LLLLLLLPGVISTEVGYSQGKVEEPSYEQVCSGSTGHAEVVQVTYDPQQVGGVAGVVSCFCCSVVEQTCTTLLGVCSVKHGMTGYGVCVVESTVQARRAADHAYACVRYVFDSTCVFDTSPADVTFHRHCRPAFCLSIALLQVSYRALLSAFCPALLLSDTSDLLTAATMSQSLYSAVHVAAGELP
jgi:hypothetical protein